jgi:hypothetical protein
MSSSSGLNQLATLLQGRGLAAMDEGSTRLAVTNPVSSRLREVIRCDSDCYVTAWGYALGQVGQERSAADRLAFLLGVPHG